jgi:hypothetical protein
MPESLFYTTLDNQEYVDNDGFARVDSFSDKVFAKAVKEVRSKDVLKRSPSYYKYYIKLTKDKSFYDPFPKHGASLDRTSFVNRICKSDSSFVEVNQSVFNKYINFLKTQNTKWLVDAQREVR